MNCFAGEKDAKRREAVRRKTAQYLLKAEALYNMYLVGNDSPEKSEQVSGPGGRGNKVSGVSGTEDSNSLGNIVD